MTAWEITVKWPFKLFRLGTVERDEQKGVLRIKDSSHVEEIPLEDVIEVEDKTKRDDWVESAFGKNPSIEDFFKPENVRATLKQADELKDPKWMVPVIFEAPDPETAFRIKDTIDMLVKHSSTRYGELYSGNVHAFGLMRFDMWNENINEFVQRPDKDKS